MTNEDKINLLLKIIQDISVLIINLTNEDKLTPAGQADVVNHFNNLTKTLNSMQESKTNAKS